MDYQINHVSSIQELEQVYAFFKEMFKGQPVVDNPEYSLAKWTDRMSVHGDLMLYAGSGSDVISLVFGRVMDNNSMIIGPVAVHEDYRGLGIAKEMMTRQEKRAARLGVQSVSLGAVEAAEKFYEKLGYTGSLLIQSHEHSIEQLLSVNRKHKVKFTDIYDGTVSQVCLELPEPDRGLQKEYEAVLPGCYTQMMYCKDIGTIR